MFGYDHPERLKLNNQIKEWNANRLDLFQISEPNDYLEFYGVMRFFYQGDDLKFQAKCLRVSSTAKTSDVVEALIVKFHPDLKMLNNDKYQLYEAHNLEDRRMRSGEHPLLVQLNWALDDKDGKFILKNESRRRRSIDMTSHSDYGMSRSTSVLTNGYGSQPLRTSSQSVHSGSHNFMKRLSSLKKSRRKSKSDKVEEEKDDAKRFSDEISGKPPDSSFTRTISNPDDVMKRRRQKKLESRLEQFSGVKGDGDTGGTLKIYGDSINPDIPYKTLLLSINDTAEKVLTETLDKYGLSSEDQRFFVLVQQNIPPRDDRNRGNIEEIILHDQDCPLGILVHCPPKRGSATFAVRRATPLDQFPSSPRMPPFSLSKKVSSAMSSDIYTSPSQGQRSSSSATFDGKQVSIIVECPRLRQVFMDTDGSLYDVQDGLHTLSSLVNVDLNESQMTGGSKFIKIGSQLSTVGDYPNILLHLDDYADIRPVHCHISAKNDPQTNSPRLQLTPTLDTTSRTPRPCVTFVNQQRIDSPTKLNNGDVIQLGESVLFRFEEFDDETSLNDDYDQEKTDEPSDSMQISYFTADLPVTVKYNYSKSQVLIDNIMTLSKDYAHKNRKNLFGHKMKLDLNNLDETFRLAPAYILYLVLRATLGDDKQIIQLINWISDQISRIINDCNNVEEEVFWLSNTSELLHLLQYDNDLKHYSACAQDVLAGAIERAFSLVQYQFSQDLMILLPSVLDEDDSDINDNTNEDNIPCLDRASVLIQHGGIDYPIQHLLQTLSLTYTLFHNCQVNVALTIQMFSQLFHLLNTWLFNSVLGDQQSDSETYPLPVCQEWGSRLMRRLNRIRLWSEINGLEMAANCHLQKMYQVAELMEADKRDLNVFGEKCIEMVNLNGAQLHHLLISCQDYELPDPWIEVVVNTAIQLHDQEFNDNNKSKAYPQTKNTLPLYEDMDLRLPLLLPADGYCCDRGIVSCPTDLRALLGSTKSILTYRLNPPVVDQVDTRWKSYLGICENTPTVSRNNTILENQLSTPMKSEAPYSEMEPAPRERYQKKINNGPQLSLYSKSQRRSSFPAPESQKSDSFDNVGKSQMKSDAKNRYKLNLTKVNNSLGLSIIALKTTPADIYRIYVKDVISGGAGDTCAKIGVGDQLVSIDGHPLENMTQDEAVATMKKTKSSVVLVVEKAAALKYGVMDKIIQARNNKGASSTQKPQLRTSSTQQQPAIKKPQSRPTKSQSPREEVQVRTDRSRVSLPTIPTGIEQPQPSRVKKTSNVKPPYRKISNQDNVQLDYNSLPIRKPKLNPPSTTDIPIYATIKNKSTNEPRGEDIKNKPPKSMSQPNLTSVAPSKIPSSESDSSNSSSSESSSDSEQLQKPKLPVKLQYNPTKTPPRPIQSQQKPPHIKSVSETNISQKYIGVPRHNVVPKDSGTSGNVSKRQIFSRPTISKSSDTIFNSPVEDDTIPDTKAHDNKKRPSSSSDSDSVSSKTLSTSSSDHEPQPQRNTYPESSPVPIDSNTIKPSKTKLPEPSKETKSSLVVANSGVAKKPPPLTSSKSSEQLSDFPNYDPKKRISPKNSRVSQIFDSDIKPITTIDVNSRNPYIGIPLPPLPPLPTASYPQYHPPDYLEEKDPIPVVKSSNLKTLTEEDLKLRKKEIADKIRKQTEDRENQMKSIESKILDTHPNVPDVDNKDKGKDKIRYGRPKFHERDQSNRPTSATKPETNFNFPGNGAEFRMPDPSAIHFPEEGIVVPPSPVVKSKITGLNEVYNDRNKSRNSQVATSQDGVEELSFREKMKLFAKKIGDEKVVTRSNFSSKERQLEDEGDC